MIGQTWSLSCVFNSRWTQRPTFRTRQWRTIIRNRLLRNKISFLWPHRPTLFYFNVGQLSVFQVVKKKKKSLWLLLESISWTTHPPAPICDREFAVPSTPARAPPKWRKSRRQMSVLSFFFFFQDMEVLSQELVRLSKEPAPDGNSAGSGWDYFPSHPCPLPQISYSPQMEDQVRRAPATDVLRASSVIFSRWFPTSVCRGTFARARHWIDQKRIDF